jgi:Rieske Fe-S protein
MINTDLITGRDNPWVDVFDATRVGGAEAVKKFVKENVFVGVHFVKDRIARLGAPDVDGVRPGEGGLIQTEDGAVGAFRDGAGRVHGVSATCTHLACTLTWNRAETSWDCPCHGSRFTYTGAVIEGPATHPLAQVEVEQGRSDP